MIVLPGAKRNPLALSIWRLEKVRLYVIRVALYVRRHYNFIVVRSYGNNATRQLFETGDHRRFQAIARVALRKLQQLNASLRVQDLASPPGNHLEALKGERAGQFIIRINDQWRLCFRWLDGRCI